MAVLGTVVGVLALLVSVISVYLFIRESKRKKLKITHHVNNVVTPNGRHEGIKVTYDGVAVTDPYIVELNAKNVGRKDIGSSDFDADSTYAIALGAEIKVEINPPKAGDRHIFTISDDNRAVLIKPTKLTVGVCHDISVLVEGKPAITIPRRDTPLKDTDILSDGGARRLRILERFIAVWLSCTVLAIFLVPAEAVFIIYLGNFGGDGHGIPPFSIAEVGPWWIVPAFWAIAIVAAANTLVGIGAALGIYRTVRGSNS